MNTIGSQRGAGYALDIFSNHYFLFVCPVSFAARLLGKGGLNFMPCLASSSTHADIVVSILLLEAAASAVIFHYSCISCTERCSDLSFRKRSDWCWPGRHPSSEPVCTKRWCRNLLVSISRTHREKAEPWIGRQSITEHTHPSSHPSPH